MIQPSKFLNSQKFTNHNAQNIELSHNTMKKKKKKKVQFKNSEIQVNPENQYIPNHIAGKTKITMNFMLKNKKPITSNS